MPDHDDLDERMARLQRTAYGAGVPDHEREAAAAELAALRSSRERPATTTARPDDPPRETAPSADGSADADESAGVGSTDPRSLPGRRRIVTASAIALLAGLAAGWTLGTIASRTGQADTIPAAETVAWRVFDAPVPNGDRVRYPAPPVEVDLDRDSRRLLAARSDGVRVVAVRSEDGRDACLVLVVPSGPSAASCTVDGRFPAEGLEVRTEQPDTGTFSASWDATGRVSLGPAVAGE